MRSLMFLLIFGLTGAAVLVSLGVWQVQRLAWKEGVLAEIDERIGDAPVALPEAPDPQRDRYLPVSADGIVAPRVIRVLVSKKQVGAGYRLISPFTTDGRRVLLDRGFVPVEADIPAPPQILVSVTGNLHWPRETDSFTPAPDIDANIWFARDVPAMAAALETEQVLIVLRAASFTDGAVTPMPVDTSGIPNDHLEYAITWFSLAAIWILMTAVFLLRSRARSQRPTT